MILRILLVWVVLSMTGAAAEAGSGERGGAAAACAKRQLEVGVVDWGADDFERRTGVDVGIGLQFCPKKSWEKAYHCTLGIKPGDGRRLAINLHPAVKEGPEDLCECARGSCDHHYFAMAEALKRNGNGDALIVAGHEFNGGWYPWISIGPGQNPPECYRDAWRNMARAFKIVSADFEFVWPLSLGVSNATPERIEQAYPGDDLVDYVGGSWYDQGPPGDGHASFRANYERPAGGRFLANFAREHGKRIWITEWGLVRENPRRKWCGDCPEFIDEMVDYLARNDGVGFIYFNTDFESDGAISHLKHHPRAAARFGERLSCDR
jgi:hypothetical protein